jgi:hypothetical protein
LGIGGGKCAAGASGGEWVFYVEGEVKIEVKSKVKVKGFNTENTEGEKEEERREREPVRDVTHSLLGVQIVRRRNRSRDGIRSTGD